MMQESRQISHFWYLLPCLHRVGDREDPLLSTFVANYLSGDRPGVRGNNIANRRTISRTYCLCIMSFHPSMVTSPVV
ncbi:hypothetical protein Scep_013988 [Stephania cephalantha]|uniref:Uncharacterized protein n=1 Tax=Stephania cephalantha TaxID=152367 RepID=A0AAP0J050_9MAGN